MLRVESHKSGQAKKCLNVPRGAINLGLLVLKYNFLCLPLAALFLWSLSLTVRAFAPFLMNLSICPIGLFAGVKDVPSVLQESDSNLEFQEA